MSKETAKGTLDNRTILTYGILSLPIGLVGFPMGVYLAPFYAGELGLPLTAVGFMLIVSRFSDFVSDPLIGMLSDRWRPRVGRRRVWVPIGTLIMMLGVYLLFRPSGDVGPLYFLAAVSITYLGYTTLQLPYTAWGAELSPHYHVRTKISATAKFFDTSGLVISTFIPAIILSNAGATSGDVMDGLSLFFLIALPICATITFINVPEPVSHSVPDVKVSAREAVTLIARNKPFFLITVAVFLAVVGEVFRQTVTVFFANEIVGVENIGAVYVYYFAVGLLTIPVWNQLAKRFEKHRALIGALAVVLVTNIGMFFLKQGQTTAFIIFFLIKGSCFGALLMLPISMIADTVDIDVALTGKRRHGLFFALTTMVQKLGYAMGQGIPLALLGFIGFSAVGENGPDELFWLATCYSIIPSICVGLAITVLIPYPLSAARHSELRNYLHNNSKNLGAKLPSFLQREKSPTERQWESL